MNRSAVPPPVTQVLDAASAWLPRRMAEVEQRLAALVGEGGPRLAAEGEATLSAGGKRLRPMLVLVCAGPEAGAGDFEPQATRRTRRRVRMGRSNSFHNLSVVLLVHDLDRAPEPRHMPRIEIDACPADRDIDRLHRQRHAKHAGLELERSTDAQRRTYCIHVDGDSDPSAP